MARDGQEERLNPKSVKNGQKDHEDPLANIEVAPKYSVHASVLARVGNLGGERGYFECFHPCCVIFTKVHVSFPVH